LTKVKRTIAEDLLSIADGALVFHATMVTRTLSAFSMPSATPPYPGSWHVWHVKQKLRCPLTFNKNLVFQPRWVLSS
jgi:hypothetical protein